MITYRDKMAASMDAIRTLGSKVTFNKCRLLQNLKQSTRNCHVSVQENISHTPKTSFAPLSTSKPPHGKIARRLQNRLLTDAVSSATFMQNLSVFRPYSVLPQRAIYTTPAWQHGAADDRTCWNCGRATDALKELFFCECGVVQTPASKATYYTLFNIDETFDVELKSLSEVYKHLQKHLHPDMYTQKSETEQQLAEQQSALLNKAYFTLLKPLPRALYILGLHGMAIEEDTTEMNPEFLMEVLELNERIGEGSTDDIKEIEKEIGAKINSAVEMLGQAFSNKDYANARDIAIRLKYYVNVESKVKTFYRDQM